MTGSGTSVDPYVVTTWGELVQVANNRNAYINFPEEPGTINIETEYGKNEPPALVIKAGVHINGNGWKIHGLWGKTHDCISTDSPYWQNYSWLNNINFSSFHSRNDYFVNCNSYPLQIQNCIFSGVCEKHFVKTRSLYDYGDKNMYIKNSSMTINFTLLTNPFFMDVSLSRNSVVLDFFDCNVKLTSVKELTLFNLPSAYPNINIHNCTFNLSSDNANIFSSSAAKTIISGCTFAGSSQSAIYIGDGTPQTVNVFNVEGFPNAVESINFVGVPHAEIGNAAYLSSKGLPIGV